MSTDPLGIFKRRILEEFLPPYCEHKKYSVAGFDDSLADIAPIDAEDCLRAIDAGLVVDDHKEGSFRAPLSGSKQYLFWEHERETNPRRITLWREPVISIACL